MLKNILAAAPHRRHLCDFLVDIIASVPTNSVRRLFCALRPSQVLVMARDARDIGL
jgi:hypothetical protein